MQDPAIPLTLKHHDLAFSCKGLQACSADDEDASTAYDSAQSSTESSTLFFADLGPEVTADDSATNWTKSPGWVFSFGDAEDATSEVEEEEVGAREEAEFSLDGRLATMKRWRGFHRQQETACIGPPGIAAAGVRCAARFGAPGIVSFTDEAVLPSPALLAPPGFNACAEEPATKESASLLHIDAGRLLETSPPWLEAQIRRLSSSALDTDTWEALLHPEPDDPRWQLLASVHCSGLIGFATYAFFEEVSECGRLIMSVQHVVVGPMHRGVGQGRRLLEELSAKACSVGAWGMKLYSKRSAVGFYERLGFQVIGPNHLMEKRLV